MGEVTRDIRGYILPFLLPSQIVLLEEYVALDDPSYDGYMKWCNNNNIDPKMRFTPRYFLNWKRRRGKTIKAIREKFSAGVGRGVVFDRRHRLAALEDDLVLIKVAMESLLPTQAGYTDDLIKLSEQKRRVLQAIAQQRGEWGAKMTDEELGKNPVNTAGQFDRYFASLDRDG